MDAAQALQELMALSSQITAAIALDADGSVLAVSPENPAATASLTSSTLELVAAASDLGRDNGEVTRVEVELDDGAFFVVREGGRVVAATTGPKPTSGLVIYDLRTCAQAIDAPEEEAGGAQAERGRRVRKLLRLVDPRPRRRLGVAKVLRSAELRGARRHLVRRRVCRRARAGQPGFRAARVHHALRHPRVTSAELGALLVERALLEGDFVLRSGRRSTWYLDKYRFETDPAILRALGDALASAARECEPDAVRLAGPALGAVALAASAAMASDLPFIIVRGETKEYGTAKRIEGVFAAG